MFKMVLDQCHSTSSECLQPMTCAANSDTFDDVCARVESTLAGVDVDAVSGIIAVVEDQAAFSDCHQLASCSLDHPDGHGESVILRMPPIAFWLALWLGSCDSSLKNSNNSSGVVNQGVVVFLICPKKWISL